MVALAPIPRASVTSAIAVNDGLLRSARKAYLRSVLTVLPSRFSVRVQVSVLNLNTNREPGTEKFERQVFRLTLFDVAVAQLDDAIAERGVRFRVRHLDDRRALLVEALEQFHDLLALRGVQVDRRLVTQGDRRS